MNMFGLTLLNWLRSRFFWLVKRLCGHANNLFRIAAPCLCSVMKKEIFSCNASLCQTTSPIHTVNENGMRYGILCITYIRFSVTSCDVGPEVITVLCPVTNVTALPRSHVQIILRLAL